jgi:hypothetical protein
MMLSLGPFERMSLGGHRRGAICLEAVERGRCFACSLDGIVSAAKMQKGHSVAKMMQKECLGIAVGATLPPRQNKPVAAIAWVSKNEHELSGPARWRRQDLLRWQTTVARSFDAA